MRQLLFLLVVLCSCQSSPTQTRAQTVNAASTERLMAAAQKMTKLFNEKNYEAFVAYVHPNLVKMMGGRETMLAAMRKEMAEMESGGVSSIAVVVEEPVQLLQVGQELQAVLPEDLTVQMGNRELQRVTYLLAISGDDGKTWYFVDVSTKSRDIIKQVIPTLSDAIVFPAPSETKVTERR